MNYKIQKLERTLEIRKQREDSYKESLENVTNTFPNNTRISDVINKLNELIEKSGDSYVHSYSIVTLNSRLRNKIVAPFTQWTKLMRSLTKIN